LHRRNGLCREAKGLWRVTEGRKSWREGVMALFLLRDHSLFHDAVSWASMNCLMQEGGGGVRSVIKGRFVASLASSSASSLPLCPWWLGIQKKLTEMWECDARSFLISMNVEVIFPVETMEDKAASESERSSIRLTSE
jgi:hypothetical protein